MGKSQRTAHKKIIESTRELQASSGKRPPAPGRSFGPSPTRPAPYWMLSWAAKIRVFCQPSIPRSAQTDSPIQSTGLLVGGGVRQSPATLLFASEHFRRIEGKPSLRVFKGLKDCRGNCLGLMPRIRLLLLLRLHKPLRFTEQEASYQPPTAPPTNNSTYRVTSRKMLLTCSLAKGSLEKRL